MERRESPPLVLLSQSSEDNARSTDAPITICQPVVIETEEAVSYWMDWKRIDRHKQAMLSSDPPRAGTSPRVSTHASPPPANLADVHRVFSELLPSGDAHELKKIKRKQGGGTFFFHATSQQRPPATCQQLFPFFSPN